MPLTSAQLATLKADILADPVMSTLPLSEGGNAQIAAIYNALASPDYWVWRSEVSKGEYTQSTSVDGTTFNWVGNGFITRSAGEQSAWRELFDGLGFANPSLPSVRQAFQDIFSGTGNAAANRTHLATISRRKALRVEKLFATGTGTTASPANMVVDGPVSTSDVLTARNLP